MFDDLAVPSCSGVCYFYQSRFSDTLRTISICMLAAAASAAVASAQLPHPPLPDAIQDSSYSIYLTPGWGFPPYHSSLATGSTLPAACNSLGHQCLLGSAHFGHPAGVRAVLVYDRSDRQFHESDPGDSTL